MKKSALLAVLTLVALAMTGCSKDTKCKCTATTAVDDQGRPLITYVDASRGFACKNITRVGFERQVDGKLIREMQDVTCVKTDHESR
ncbi:MAG: hypothetical protein IKN11_03270 [Bacteroidales bacterium]|nr:hypothetical protein [Bacteroidales bacterium]